MTDRSYQWLKDATSFGLISDKSTEIQGSEYWENCQFSILAEIGPFHPSWAWLTPSDVTHMCKSYFQTKLCVGQAASMENFQIIKYFESDYLVILSDNRANEVAPCRY